MFRKSTLVGAIIVLLFSFLSSIISVQAVSTTKVSAPDLEEPDTGMIYTPEKSPEGDPLKGGALAINQKFSVPGTEVSYNDLFTYHVGFKITWTVPEGITPQQFINALDMNNTSIWLGNNKLEISRDSFEINAEGKIEYKASSNSFELFLIFRYLWSLVFGRGTAEIWSYLYLDVNKLSENNPNDFSIGKIVTEGKLPPNQTNELSSTVTLYGLKDILLRTNRLSTDTWSNYISPWSAEKANSEENGKKDDTQVDGSTEVLGINRVLKGSDYKNRTVEIPITEKINPLEYIRVVNLFTKQVVTNVPVTIDSPAVKDDIDKQGNTSFLNRSTTYYYRGDQLLSPVPIHFLQKSHLKLVVNGGGNYSEKEEIPLKGMVETEGETVHYFYRVDQGEELPLENKSNNPKQLGAIVPGLTAGDHTITIKAVNEFGLYNTAEVRVTVYSGQLSLYSVPNRINFGETKKSSETITLPGISEGNLIVSDTRPETKKTNWVLNLRSSVSLVGEHTSLTYTNRKNKQLMINQADQPIEENLPNKPDKDNISEGWSNKTQGLFLKIPPEDQKIGEYSGKLIWTLQNTPSPN
ncbi:hypothetical protein [Leuconostoc mesenteroides]|uniref:hypothetical protein n=1 Tax=Leuconostoc mesenteroides TaxID=1245 RepID=UPI001CBCDCF7|nr:hypothetical protein [Leuconostoc mesenteroides]MBZ1509561.1 hypothetical protein [Leuconostoc mesenteroides]MBZ1534312.1 hypothetical protein [Leuconostoc mesenteroides]